MCYRYTEFALRRYIELAGLQLLSLEPLGGPPEVMAELFAKHVARVPLVGPAIVAFT
jgi:hypothetical protein